MPVLEGHPKGPNVVTDNIHQEYLTCQVFSTFRLVRHGVTASRHAGNSRRAQQGNGYEQGFGYVNLN